MEEEMSWWGKHPILYYQYQRFLRKGTCWDCRRKFNMAVKDLVAKKEMRGFEDVSFGFDQLCDKCQNNPVVLRIKEKYDE